MNTAEKYMLLMLNRRGDFSVLDRSSKMIGVLACGLSDLIREHFITLDEKQTIIVRGKLLPELESLESLYEYLKANEVTPYTLVYDYVIRMTDHWEELFQSLGRSLTRQEMVKPSLRDSLITKVLYIPERDKLDDLLWDMKWSLTREAIAPAMLDLWNILREIGQAGYFTDREERKLLRERGQSEAGELAKQMVLDYRVRR